MKMLPILLFCCLSALHAVCQTRVISAKCGYCKRPVSIASRVGDKCPHCGVIWGREDNTYTRQYVSPPPARPAPDTIRKFPVRPYVQPPRPTKPVVNVAEYGSKVSYGFSLLGGGSLFGVPFRYNPNSELAIEAGMHYSPSTGTSPFDDKFRLEPGVMLSGGATFFGQKTYRSWKDKVKRNGFTFRTGRSFGEYPQIILLGGWASESFRRGNTHKSFILELGGGLAWQKFYSGFLGESKYDHEFRFFAKLHWNRYIK